VVVGPILSDSRSDVFCDNENGPNFLFKNNGDGTFVDVAKQSGAYEDGYSQESTCVSSSGITNAFYIEGVDDRYQHGRGVALADFNGDGKTDIVYGNWNGPHRLFLQGGDMKFRVKKSSRTMAEQMK